MKIEVKQRGSKEFYDESLYLANNLKKLISNPSKKYHRFTIVLLTYSLFLFLSIILFAYFFYTTHNNLYILGLGFLVFVLFFLLLLYYNILKQIKFYMNQDGIITIFIDDEIIEYKDSNKSINFKWNEISNVVINKNSISFIPKKFNPILIVVNIEYKKELIDILKKYNKLDLVIDNTK